jgi:hypothetical protein
MFIAPKKPIFCLLKPLVIFVPQTCGSNKQSFNLANEIDFPMSVRRLKILHEKIFRLIQYKFAEYLNLLYIIDVSEEE